jgi:hypothetical protein
LRKLFLTGEGLQFAIFWSGILLPQALLSGLDISLLQMHIHCPKSDVACRT